MAPYETVNTYRHFEILTNGRNLFLIEVFLGVSALTA